MSKKTPIAAAVAVMAMFMAAPVWAQSQASVKSAVERALAGNPELSAKAHALLAAGEGVNVAKGGRMPRLDLNGDVGHDRSTFTTGPTSSVNRAGLGLALSYLLWDGLGTKFEIDRNNHERLARYFELLDATEQTALEASRALYDVHRYRQLVALAEDNLAQHKAAAQKISSRVGAGVGRGVDLEQANARVALAEANLSNEMSNLHDVTARYQRIVGDLPLEGKEAPEPLTAELPANPSDALRGALTRSHAISAAVETVRASQAAVRTRQSLSQPQVEARLRTGAGRNYAGVQAQRSDTAAEVLLNWTLFDGGANRARVQQQVNLVNQAADLRDKTCRDVRQTALIAHNEVLKTADQVATLERNTQAIEKARDAYRQQFEIGQRSLLDLLNAENEAYTARRSLLNAQFDRAVAHARTQASMSQLNSKLGIARTTRIDVGSDWNMGTDGAVRCPAQAINTAAMDAGARRPATPAPAAASAPAPAPVTTAAVSSPLLLPPVQVGAPVAAPKATPAASTAEPAADTADFPGSLVNQWAEAWRTKGFDRYAAFYAPDFAGADGSHDAWLRKRRVMVTKPGPINLRLGPVTTQTLPDGSVQTRFRQDYRSNNYQDTSVKTLVWKRVNGQWLIVGESNR